MVRKCIELEEWQSRELERRAREQGVSFSELVRRAIEMFLSRDPRLDEMVKPAQTGRAALAREFVEFAQGLSIPQGTMERIEQDELLTEDNERTAE